MRFFGLIFAFLAALALAQNNAISTPEGGFGATAGGTITLSFVPSTGTVSVYLTQGSNLAPGTGTLLASNVDASSGTVTVTIPTDVNTGTYNFAIADSTTGAFINFSSGFTIAGATQTATSSASVSSSASSSSTATGSSSTVTSSSSESSASTSGTSTSRASTSTSASRTSSASASATSVAANGAGLVQAGGFLAIMAGAIAVF